MPFCRLVLLAEEKDKVDGKQTDPNFSFPRLGRSSLNTRSKVNLAGLAEKEERPMITRRPHWQFDSHFREDLRRQFGHYPPPRLVVIILCVSPARSEIKGAAAGPRQETVILTERANRHQVDTENYSHAPLRPPPVPFLRPIPQVFDDQCIYPFYVT